MLNQNAFYQIQKLECNFWDVYYMERE